MTVRVAINGFGRIGRLVLRAIVESKRRDIVVVGVNDLGPIETNAHLLRYDSVHGRFPGTVEWSGENPGISLKSDPNGPFTTLASFFRVVLSPHGRGHALVLMQAPHQADPVLNLCLTDNEPLARARDVTLN